MMSTRRVACSYGPLRHFSANNGNVTSSPQSASAASAAAGEAITSITATTSSSSSLPPWLNRWLNLWDKESGTHEILHLKRKVHQSSMAFDDKQKRVAQARTSLEYALRAFEDSQQQHNQLLQTRDRWTASQALELAKLLEKEAGVRKQLEGCKKDLAKSESEQLRAMNDYMNRLRQRYQEEQLWQDKWRIYSTFGTWGLIVLNSMVFLVGQYLYRSREHRRMIDFKELLEQSLTMNEGTLRAVREQMQEQHRRPHGIQGEEEITPRQDENGKMTEAKEPGAESPGDTLATVEVGDPSLSEMQNSTPSHWAKMVQYTRNASKKCLQEGNRVDVPSALLGASVTGMAWLIAMTLSSGKGGVQ